MAENLEEPYSDSLMANYFWSLVRNIEALCAESEDLRDRGSHGRALALAIVAIEESAKAQNVLDWDEEARTGARPDPKHAVERQQHRVKSSLAIKNHILGDADYDAPLPEIDTEEALEAIIEQMGAFYAEIRQHGLRTARLRERGLYVDLDDEGTGIFRPTHFRAEDVNEYLNMVPEHEGHHPARRHRSRGVSRLRRHRRSPVGHGAGPYRRRVGVSVPRITRQMRTADVHALTSTGFGKMNERRA